MKKDFVSIKTIHFSLKYIYYALRIPLTFETLKPHLEVIIFDILIPITYLTPIDQEIWNNGTFYIINY